MNDTVANNSRPGTLPLVSTADKCGKCIRALERCSTELATIMCAAELNYLCIHSHNGWGQPDRTRCVDLDALVNIQKHVVYVRSMLKHIIAADLRQAPPPPLKILNRKKCVASDNTNTDECGDNRQPDGAGSAAADEC